MKKCLIFIVLVVTSVFGVNAQYANQQALYGDLPQAKYLSPGIFPEYSGYFSFPALSGWGVTGTNSAFSWNDMFENGKMKMEGLVPKLNDNNYLNVGLGFDVFGLGFKSGKNFFSFNLSPKIDVNLGYNKAVFDFLTNGNGAYVGKDISLDGFGFDITAYTEAGIGYTREVNEKLNVGGRVKLLLGLANINGNFDGISLYTDPDDYALTATSEFGVNAYGAFFANDSIAEVLGNPSAVNFSNIGFGLDVGGEYELNEKVNLFASVVDLGFIKWADYGESLSNDGSSFTFDGIPFAELLGDDSGGSSEEESGFFSDLGDSLSNTFELERSQISYTTRLKTRIFAGASYKLNDFFDGQGMVHGRVFNNKFYPSYMLAGNFHVKKWLTTKLTYSGANGTFDNLGAGLVLHLGAFQVYGMFDNAFGLAAVDYAKFLNASFGINFTFKGEDGELKKAKAKKEKAEKKKEKLEKNNKLSEEKKKKEIEKQEKIISDQQKELDKAEEQKEKAEDKKGKAQEKKEEQKEKVEEKKEEQKEKAEDKKEKAQQKKEEQKKKVEEKKEEAKELKEEAKELKQEQKELKKEFKEESKVLREEQKEVKQELKEIKEETKALKEDEVVPASFEVEKDSTFKSPSSVEPSVLDSSLVEPEMKSDSLKMESSLIEIDSSKVEIKIDSLSPKKEPLKNLSDSLKSILEE